MIKDVIMRGIGRQGEGALVVVAGPFRSVQRSGRCGVGELNDRAGDPAPRVSAVVIASGRKLLDAPVALLERFVAIPLQHQGGGAPDIDLGYHRVNTDNCVACEAACQGGDRWQRY